MQQELLPCCPTCGQLLQYPGVPLTPKLMKLFRLIDRNEFELGPPLDLHELACLMELNKNTIGPMISKINKAIRPKGLVIYSRPYRIVKTRYPGT